MESILSVPQTVYNTEKMTVTDVSNSLLRKQQRCLAMDFYH